MKFIKATTLVFSTRVVSLLISLATGIIIARKLGPSGKGVLALAFLIPGLMAQFSNMGINTANIFFISKEKIGLKKITSNSIIFAFLISIILILSFTASLDFWETNFLRDVKSFYVLIAVFSLPLSLILLSVQGILLAKNQITKYNLLSILPVATNFFLIFLFLVILKRGIFAAILSALAGSFLSFIFGLMFARRITNFNLKFNFETFKRQVGYGIKPYFGNLFAYLNFKMDMLLVAYFLDITQVGLYALAVGLVGYLKMIPNVVETTFFPRISSFSSQKANEVTPITYKQLGILMFSIGIVFFLISKPFIRFLYGAPFIPSLIPLRILLVGTIIYSNIGIPSLDMAGRGKPIYATISNLLSLIVNVSLNLILIPKMGIAGAALATSISAVTNVVFILIVYSKVSKNSLSKMLLINGNDIQVSKQLLSYGFLKMKSKSIKILVQRK